MADNIKTIKLTMPKGQLSWSSLVFRCYDFGITMHLEIQKGFWKLFARPSPQPSPASRSCAQFTFLARERGQIAIPDEYDVFNTILQFGCALNSSVSAITPSPASIK